MTLVWAHTCISSLWALGSKPDEQVSDVAGEQEGCYPNRNEDRGTGEMAYSQELSLLLQKT